MSVRTVVVAHREGLAAEGIAAALGRYPAMVMVGVATSAADLERCAARADVAAVDARIPGADGAAKRLLRRGLRVVMIDEDGAAAGHGDALEEGTKVSTSAGVGRLALALVPGSRPEPSPVAVLTARERDVLRLTAKGLSGKQVARVLDISPKTVEQHKTKIYRKLGVPNQAAAAAVLAGIGKR